MFENPRKGRQARNFTTNVPKVLDLKLSSEQIFFRKLSLGAPESYTVQIGLNSVVKSLLPISVDKSRKLFVAKILRLQYFYQK